MDITTWLEEFNHGWTNHDVDLVMSLFTKDVEYWENPFLRMKSYLDLRNEWQSIKKQSNIKLTTTVKLSSGDMHTVLWELTYVDESKIAQTWAGTYIIGLNNSGKCYYFHHTGENKN